MAKKKYYIYKHTFPNNKVYIGITCQLPEMRWGHNGEGYLQLNKKGQPTQVKMYNAIQKYGWKNIKHEIIEIVYTKEEAELKEQYYITKIYKSHFAKYGYNIMLGGSYNNKLSAKTKHKISTSIKQAYQTSETMWMKRLLLKFRRSWTNGKEDRLSIQQPGEDFYPGKRLRYLTETHKFFSKKAFIKRSKLPK